MSAMAPPGPPYLLRCLPRLPIPAMSPKSRASAPEPSTSSSDASSDSSSSDGEQLPAQQTTRSGRTSAPPPRHVPSPGKLYSEEVREALTFPTGAEAIPAGTVVRRHPFRFKRRGKLLYGTDSNFLSMDGAAAGSGGRKFSPYSHGRHDADKGQLGASIQCDLVPKAHGKASAPGRGRLRDQAVTRYYATGQRLNDHRAVDRADHSQPDAVEKLRQRRAETHPVRLDSSGAGPSDLRHYYMCETRDSGPWYYWPPKRVADPQPPHHRVCATCRASLHNGSLDKEEHRASRCGLAYQCPDGACGPHGC
jgi:hypothetical protein